MWPKARWAQAQAVLEFVRERGVVHPREVDAQFAHGKVKNWFGGTSNASTQLLDGMHYRGLLRIARRDGGVRLYAARDAHAPAPDPAAALDALVDVVVDKYAPLPERSLGELVMPPARRRAAVGATARRAALARAQGAAAARRASTASTWYWPAGENPASRAPRATTTTLRLLAPFDPVVWDRRRFEAFWGWAYRFEAYTPAPQRVRGYYALPMLWREPGHRLGQPGACATARSASDSATSPASAPRGAGPSGARSTTNSARAWRFLGLPALTGASAPAASTAAPPRRSRRRARRA